VTIPDGSFTDISPNIVGIRLPWPPAYILLEKGVLMTIRKWHAMLALGTGAAAAATSLTLTLAGTSAGAAPVTQFVGTSAGANSAATSGDTTSGDNGTVKIHRSTTPVTDRRNEPHVCLFYLDAFGFDANQSVSWWIKSWPPTGNRSIVASGTLTLDSSGDGHTGNMTLANGHYKLFWTFAGEHGSAKHKVFWVACASPSPSPSPSPSSSSASPSPSPSSS
jgi:hypothetical protein